MLDPLDQFLAERFDLSPATKAGYRSAFLAVQQFTATPFTLDRAGMLAVLGQMDARYKSQTWNTFVQRIRRVYTWLGRGDVVVGIHLKRVRREDYVKTKLLSEEEVRRLLQAASTPRDRAFLAVAAATGARRSEVMGLRIRDVIPRPYGYDTLFTGKTGTHPGPVIVKDFAKILRVWLEHHPDRHNLDASLWLRRGDAAGIQRSAAAAIIRKAARAAGFTRNVHLHMLRHTEATWEAKRGVTATARRKLHGWSMNSTMPSLYEHFTDDDAVNADLRSQGILPASDQPSAFQPVTCGYCGEANPSEYTYCHYCGTPLSADTAQLAASKRRLAELLSNDELYAKFARFLAKLAKDSTASRE